jgi:microcystin-dependent protein
MSDAINYQWVLDAPDKSALYALSGVQRAFLLSVLSMVASWSWVNASGLRLTDEQKDAVDKIMADTFEDISMPIVGMIIAAPIELAGFLVCDGATYNTDDYPRLADVLGATGDTFNVPDLRNQFVLGASFFKPVGSTGGDENVTLNELQMPIHAHAESIAVPFLGEIGAGIPVTYAIAGAGVTGTAGGGQSHNNMPPYVAMLYQISAG